MGQCDIMVSTSDCCDIAVLGLNPATIKAKYQTNIRVERHNMRLDIIQLQGVYVGIETKTISCRATGHGPVCSAICQPSAKNPLFTPQISVQ